MTGTRLFAVDELRITEPDVLHDTGEGGVPHLDSQMEVRRHQTKSMDAIIEAFNTFLQQQKETRTVPASKKTSWPLLPRRMT
jgi:hypothetical protein